MRLFKRRPGSNALMRMPVRYHTVIAWEMDHVRAAVLDLRDGSAQMAGVATAPVNGISRTAHPDVERWCAGVSRALGQAEDMTSNTVNTRMVPDYVTMCIPSEIATQIPVQIDQARRRASERITLAEMSDMLRRGFRSAQDKLDGHGVDPTHDHIHGVLSTVRIDGERVSDPIGLHGSTVTLDMAFSVAPMEWVRALESIAETLKTRLVDIVPHHVAYASAVGDGDAVLVVIEPRHTTATVVRRGRPGPAVVIDTGQEDITESIAATMRLEGRQAEALMRAYRGGQLREDIEYSLARIFWKELRGWMDEMARGLSAVHNNGPMPERMVVADLSRRLPEGAHSLETPYWESCLPFSALPTASTMEIEQIAGVLDCSGQAGGSGYVLLRSLCRYVAHLYSNLGELDRRLVEMVCWQSPGNWTAKRIR